MEESKKNTFYDHFAQTKPTGFGRWLVVHTANIIFDFAQIKQDSVVLEIGPGRGDFADLCLDKGIEYWAVEPNEKMAQSLESKGINVIRKIVPPLRDVERKFDVVIMNNVLEHMDTMTSALEISKDIYNLLNQGGRFVIYSPDYVNFGYLFFLNDFSHSFITTWERLEGLLISAGYERIHTRYQNAFCKGIACMFVSGPARWLPFGRLHATFPKNKYLSKLYRLQSPFLRRILISGIRQS